MRLLATLLVLSAVRGEVSAQRCASTVPGQGLALTNHADRFLLTSTGKAGATVASQMMFRREGRNVGSSGFYRIHDYRLRFQQEPNHKPVRWSGARTAKECTSRWTCVAVIRSPFDRVVSSYYHIMLSPFKNHVKPIGASFRQFVDFLERPQRVVRGQWQPSYYIRGHAGSQAWDGQANYLPTDTKAKDGQAIYGMGPVKGLHYLPTDMIGHGAVEALNRVAPVARLTWSVNDTSSHYRVGKPRARLADPSGTADVPWSVLKDMWTKGDGAHPPYDDFLTDKALARKVLGCLFLFDAELYAFACQQPWLSACDACAAACDWQLARMRNATVIPPGSRG